LAAWLGDRLRIVGELFSEQQAVDIDSFDADLIQRLKLLTELEDDERKSICHIIDMAVNKKRLTDSLTNALKLG